MQGVHSHPYSSSSLRRQRSSAFAVDFYAPSELGIHAGVSLAPLFFVAPEQAGVQCLCC